MRKLMTSLLVASFVSVLGVSCADAVAQTGTHAQTATQVKWEKFRGVWSWNQNQTFIDELRSSVEQYFGNTVGAYFDQSPVASHPIPLTKWSLISAQFFGHLGENALSYDNFSRGTILNGRLELYEYEDGTSAVVAWVTPIGSTNVVAAAITHRSCGSLALKDIDDPAAFEAHFTGKCSAPKVTIFFKDRFSYNQAIHDVLVKQMSQDLVRDCNHDFTHTPGSDSNRYYVAMHGHQPPPCGMRWHVVMLNEVPQE